MCHKTAFCSTPTNKKRKHNPVAEYQTNLYAIRHSQSSFPLKWTDDFLVQHACDTTTIQDGIF